MKKLSQLGLLGAVAMLSATPQCMEFAPIQVGSVPPPATKRGKFKRRTRSNRK